MSRILFPLFISGKARQPGPGQERAGCSGDQEGEREPPDCHRDPQTTEQKFTDREGDGGGGPEQAGNLYAAQPDHPHSSLSDGRSPL